MQVGTNINYIANTDMAKQAIYPNLLNLETMRNRNMGLIFGEQIQILLNKARKYYNDISMVTPERIIQVGKRADDLRICPEGTTRYYWDSDYFVDPLLRRLLAFPADEYNFYVNISYNFNRAIALPNVPDHEKHRFACFTHPDFYDKRSSYLDINRLSYPLKRFDTRDFAHERVRLRDKTYNLIDRLKTPLGRFKHLKEYEYKTWNKHNLYNLKTDPYFMDKKYLIYLGSYGIRAVDTRIEQWIWEKHIHYYGADLHKIFYLNELIMDDDGRHCTIFVPETWEDYQLFGFLNRIQGYKIIDGQFTYIPAKRRDESYKYVYDVPLDRQYYYKDYI